MATSITITHAEGTPQAVRRYLIDQRETLDYLHDRPAVAVPYWVAVDADTGYDLPGTWSMSQAGCYEAASERYVDAALVAFVRPVGVRR